LAYTQDWISSRHDILLGDFSQKRPLLLDLCSNFFLLLLLGGMSLSKDGISNEEIVVSRSRELERQTSYTDSKHDVVVEDVEKDPENLKTEEPVYDVFGKDEEHSIRYKTMSWVKCGVVMIAETIALGVLSLPSVLLTVGMVPGIILIIGLGVIATYTGYNLGLFRLNHPTVCNMADAGEVLWGPFGKYLLGAGQVIFLVFVCASHCLTGAIAMNTLTDNATCKVVWSMATGVVAFFLTLPRTLERMSYLCFVSAASILTSVFITIVGTGVESAPNGAPPNPDIIVKSFKNPSFYSAFSAVTVSCIVFYCFLLYLLTMLFRILFLPMRVTWRSSTSYQK